MRLVQRAACVACSVLDLDAVLAAIVRGSIQLVAIGGGGLVLVGVGIPSGPLRNPPESHLSIRMGHAGVTAIVFSRLVAAPLLFPVAPGGSFPANVYLMADVCFGRVVHFWGDVECVRFLSLVCFVCVRFNMIPMYDFRDSETCFTYGAVGVFNSLVGVVRIALRINLKDVVILPFYIMVF